MANIPDEVELKVKLSFRDDLLPYMAAIVRPGDTMVVSFEGRITMQQASELQERWHVITKGTSNIAFLENVAEITVLRPDENIVVEDRPFFESLRDVREAVSAANGQEEKTE
jgi:hypothetical protein